MDKVIVISGAGISAESGLKTFRDEGGLWRSHSFYELATPEAWARNPQLVLDFYNERRRIARDARPNAAHYAIADLERQYEVVIISQNVDSLHERAGSSRVIHLHGELDKVRSTTNSQYICLVDGDIQLGEVCPQGGQLRPHIVWFGETVMDYDVAQQEVATADKVLVVGTSLSVYPAAGLVQYAPAASEKVLITREIEQVPRGYRWLQGNASEQVPKLCRSWLY